MLTPHVPQGVRRRWPAVLLGGLLTLGTTPGWGELPGEPFIGEPQGIEERSIREETPVRPADAVLDSLSDEQQILLREVLERHPGIARARTKARMADAQAPQVKALPDPVAAFQVFLLPPETRVGPQRLSVSWSQKFPWFGKLALRERAALYEAVAARLEVEVVRLAVLTETRLHLEEISFLERHGAILREERQHLVRHEEAARARYTAGVGLQQAVIKIQAEITRIDRRLVSLESRRKSLESTINTLRNRPFDFPLSLPSSSALRVPELDPETLRDQARGQRPEFRQAEAEIARARVLEELALKGFRPDFQVGLAYTLVEGRSDAAGRANPPEDDGDDILALSASLNLPVRRSRLEAAFEEAGEGRRLAEEEKRQLEASIEGALGEHSTRLPLLADERRLLETVLLAQAEEALRSAEAAYSAGKLGALELLDAEHVLFEVRTAIERLRTDIATTLIRLEAVVAAPLAFEEAAR